jgi:hypothetical protein
MTPITRKLVRIATAKSRGAELHAAAIFVPTKGSRESFPISYTDLHEPARQACEWVYRPTAISTLRRLHV